MRKSRIRNGDHATAQKSADPPAQIRMTMTFDSEFQRKLVTYCKWHRITPSAFVQSRTEESLRSFVIQHRTAAVAQAEAGPSILVVDEAPEEERRAAG